MTTLRGNCNYPTSIGFGAANCMLGTLAAA